MPEQKHGFFPWKIEQLMSIVPDFAQDMRERQQSKCLRPSDKRDSLRDNHVKSDAEPELVAETKTTVVEVPREVIDQFRPANTEEDWEVLSGKMSSRSLGGEIMVPRVGSVRSIDHEHSSHTTLPLSFKIQRTSSSSTLDSQDNVLGPSGKGVLGVDYVEHIVLPTDTLQGVCLAYKVSGSHLRRANHFSGNSLHSAPKKLLIPLSKQALRTGFIRVQDTDTKDYKLSYFQAEYSNISATEARA
jgi:LysM repeat protein